MSDSPPPSILVVDDTVENLRLLANMLGDHGYEVRPVTSGRQALQAVAHDPPDLILLDINMPEMDGYEVCQKLKEREELREIPVIFLTALTDTAEKIKAFAMGGVDYVTKPFQFEEVLARVKVQVGLRRARRELTQSYERLLELEKLRDNLVHMVVHDMRSPLTVVIGRLQLLQAKMTNRPGTAEPKDLAGALESASVVNRMANDLLDVSRLEEGKMPLNRALCDIRKVAQDVSAGLVDLDRGRTIVVDADVPGEIECDASIIRRVLENIVNNGIKHTPAGSPLRISVTAGNKCIRVAVHDKGSGVPPEARRKIFEKFGAVETRQDRTYHSAGLGLAFCKLAVEAHGGTIGVDDGDGGGSTFWFELPRG